MSEWFDSIKESLPVELQANEALAQLNDLPAALNKLVSAESMIGRSVRIPGEGATDEARAAFRADLTKVGAIMLPGDGASEDEVSAFRSAIGVPDDAKGYSLDGIEPPEGVTLEEGWQDQLTAKLHAIGVPAGMAAELVKMDLERMGESFAQAKEAALATTAALKTEWGEAFDKNMALAGQAAETLLGSSDVLQGALGNDADALKGLAAYGARLLEDGTLTLPGAVRMGMTPAEIDAEIAEIRANPVYTNAHNPMDPAYKALADRMHKLHEMKFGSGGPNPADGASAGNLSPTQNPFALPG